MEHSPVWPVYYIMKNIGNKKLTKLIKNKRFSSTVRNYRSKTTTYNYRITNVKMSYGKEDPTTTTENWRATIVNIVCSAYTTHKVRKKVTPKDVNTNPENRYDKRYSPIRRDAMSKYGDWEYSLRSWGNPKQPRRDIRYALLSDTRYNETHTSHELRNFLKHIGIAGDLKIGTIKLVHTQEL
jgi:hypothetical protein